MDLEIDENILDLSNASTDEFVDCSQSQIDEKKLDLLNDGTANSLIDSSQSPTDYIVKEATTENNDGLNSKKNLTNQDSSKLFNQLFTKTANKVSILYITLFSSVLATFFVLLKRG